MDFGTRSAVFSMMIGYFYTGGPYPIAYTPFGELFSGVVMGMLLILIAFYIQTGTVTTQAVLLSIPSMILVAGIMLSNNIRDIEQDTIGGRKTLAILVGRSNAITVLTLFFVISYILDCCTCPIWTVDTMGISHIPQC